MYIGNITKYKSIISNDSDALTRPGARGRLPFLPTRRDNVALKTNLKSSYHISIAHSRPAKRENDSALATKRLKSPGNSLIRIFPRDTRVSKK